MSVREILYWLSIATCVFAILLGEWVLAFQALLLSGLTYWLWKDGQRISKLERELAQLKLSNPPQE